MSCGFPSGVCSLYTQFQMPHRTAYTACVDPRWEAINNTCVPRCPADAHRTSAGVCGEDCAPTSPSACVLAYVCVQRRFGRFAAGVCAHRLGDDVPTATMQSRCIDSWPTHSPTLWPAAAPAVCLTHAKPHTSITACLDTSLEVFNYTCVVRCPAAATRALTGACGEPRQFGLAFDNKRC